jgi:hypothetical protein
VPRGGREIWNSGSHLVSASAAADNAATYFENRIPTEPARAIYPVGGPTSRNWQHRRGAEDGETEGWRDRGTGSERPQISASLLHSFAPSLPHGRVSLSRTPGGPHLSTDAAQKQRMTAGHRRPTRRPTRRPGRPRNAALSPDLSFRTAMISVRRQVRILRDNCNHHRLRFRLARSVRRTFRRRPAGHVVSSSRSGPGQLSGANLHPSEGSRMQAFVPDGWTPGVRRGSVRSLHVFPRRAGEIPDKPPRFLRRRYSSE